VKQICAHLNAFHAYVSEPTRAVETNHYCAHVNEGKRTIRLLAKSTSHCRTDVRQCLLYDSHEANARLIGIEYMITPKLYQTLDSEEKKLWHSHVFEVKSGMLIMPVPRGVPQSIWEVAETKEMGKVIELYGKVYHLWQTDKGDKLPLGTPQLMTSYTSADQFDFKRMVSERDERFGSDYTKKKELRKDIPEPNISDGNTCELLE
jgi:hypothetical protein